MADPKKPTLTIVEGSGKADEISRLEARHDELAQELQRVQEDLAELRGTREKVAEVIYGLPFGKAPKKTKTAAGGEAEVIPLFGESEPDVISAAKNLSDLREAKRLVDELALVDVDEIRDRLGDNPVLKRAFLDELERRLMGTEQETPLPPVASARAA